MQMSLPALTTVFGPDHDTALIALVGWAPLTVTRFAGFARDHTIRFVSRPPEARWVPSGLQLTLWTAAVWYFQGGTMLFFSYLSPEASNLQTQPG